MSAAALDHYNLASQRLGMPAWAKSLIALRMAGRHPMFVNVLVGNDWSRPREYWDKVRFGSRKLEPFSAGWRKVYGDPWVVLGSGMLVQRSFDVRCVAGCVVFLHHESLAASREPLDEAEPLFDLVKALGEQCACIYLEPAIDGCVTASGLAGVLRLGLYQWPRWWSDELDREHGRKQREWDRAFAAFSRAAAA